MTQPEREGPPEPKLGSDADAEPSAPRNEGPKLERGAEPDVPSWRQKMMKWLVPALLVAFALGTYLTSDEERSAELDYTTFYGAVENREVKSVVMRGDEVAGELSTPRRIDGRETTRFRTQLPKEDAALLPLLRANGVTVRVEAGDRFAWSDMFVGMLPWLLIMGAWFWWSNRARKAGSGAQNPMSALLGKHGKRFEREDAVDVRFEDVAGLEGAKRDLGEIVDFLRDPESFETLGGKMPRGALLVGAPGTGKTLLARAVAGEANVPFFSISGSEFIELFVGVGASRVRELFEAAKKAPHAIIFIDEIDAVGRSRGAGLGGGNDEREQTLNQLLAAMDGFDRTDRVVVLAATNRPDVLDSALLRPGRFDRRILVDLPACSAREAILNVHVRGKPLAADVALGAIASATPGLSGADLANLVNEATLRAIRRGAVEVTAEDFDLAYDKILLGEPREAHLSVDEKRRVAVHEAGHAAVAHLLDSASPLRRVSILPRGHALGATQQSASRADTHLQTKSELLTKLAVLVAGYAAERLVLGEVSTGAENDLRQASNIAQRMVAQLGMSEGLGPVYHEHRSEHPFLGQASKP